MLSVLWIVVNLLSDSVRYEICIVCSSCECVYKLCMHFVHA